MKRRFFPLASLNLYSIVFSLNNIQSILFKKNQLYQLYRIHLLRNLNKPYFLIYFFKLTEISRILFYWLFRPERMQKNFSLKIFNSIDFNNTDFFSPCLEISKIKAKKKNYFSFSCLLELLAAFLFIKYQFPIYKVNKAFQSIILSYSNT